MSAHRSALLCWGAPKPSAGHPTRCTWQWRNWLLSECSWESHSAALSADRDNKAWACPVLPQRRRPETLAGSAEGRGTLCKALRFLFICLSLWHAGTTNVFSSCEFTHRIFFSHRDDSHWQGDCVFMDKGEEDTCAARWTYAHLYFHIPAVRIPYLHMHKVPLLQEAKSAYKFDSYTEMKPYTAHI